MPTATKRILRSRGKQHHRLISQKICLSTYRGVLRNCIWWWERSDLFFFYISDVRGASFLNTWFKNKDNYIFFLRPDYGRQRPLATIQYVLFTVWNFTVDIFERYKDMCTKYNKYIYIYGYYNTIRIICIKNRYLINLKLNLTIFRY